MVEIKNLHFEMEKSQPNKGGSSMFETELFKA